MRFDLCDTAFEFPETDKTVQTLAKWNVNQREIGVIRANGTAGCYHIKRDRVAYKLATETAKPEDLMEPGSRPAIVIMLQFVPGVSRSAGRVHSVWHRCVIAEDGTAMMHLNGGWHEIDFSDYITDRFLKTELRKLTNRM